MLNDAELSRWMDDWQDRLYDMCPERGEDGGEHGRMKDLIDRETAIKEIEKEFAEFITSHGYDSYEKANIFFQWYCDGMMKAIGILLDMEAEQPTVEPLTDADGERREP